MRAVVGRRKAELTVTVVGTSGQTLTDSIVRDGQEVFRTIDRRRDTSPNVSATVSRCVVRRGKIPGQRSLCLPLGATQPQKAC